MQKLHLVGFTTDHRALILSVRRRARTGGYVLELDDKVTASVTDALARRAAALAADPNAEAAPDVPVVRRPESSLTVRELQTRLRAGRSVADVAAEAGVDPEWVERFAPPVLAEQSRVIDATRAARFERSRLGRSGLPLGQAVYRNLVERGVRTTADELDKGWSARQGADGRWLVTLTYSSRGRKQTPTWELEGPRGPVRADDRLAAELAYVAEEPIFTPPPPGKPPKVPPTAPSDGDREAARRVAIARKEAEAQLDEAARAASRRNAERARLAATVKKEPPAPVPAPKAKARPAKKGTRTAPRSAKATTPKRTRSAPARSARATTPRPAKPKARRAAPARPKSARAKPPKVTATRAARAKAKPAKAAKAAKARAQAGATAKKATRTTKPGAAAPRRATGPANGSQAGGTTPRQPRHAASGRATSRAADPVAAVSRARAEAQAELEAFVARQAGAGSAGRPAPVFRTDLATPAGQNGDEGSAAPRPRPRRTEPLRAR